MKHLIRDVLTMKHMLDVSQAYENAFERDDLEGSDFISDLEIAGFRVFMIYLTILILFFLHIAFVKNIGSHFNGLIFDAG